MSVQAVVLSDLTAVADTRLAADVHMSPITQ